MSWTLTYQSQTKTLAEWGLCHLKRTCLNQGRDTVTFEEEDSESLTSVPKFSAWSTIEIYHNDTRWFVGTIVGTPAYGNGNRESKEYQVYGPWYALESLIYQQPWHIASDPTDPESTLIVTNKSHVILGQNLNGNIISISTQLADILSFAQNAGISINYNSSTFNQVLPLDECKDISCAEALQRILRWIPDIVTWWDYATSTPTLYIRRRSELTSYSLALGPTISELRIVPRNDLQLAGVILKYERTHHSSGCTWRTLESDIYPTGTTDQTPRVLVMTIELEGSRSTYIKQTIETAAIYPSSATWWKSQLPALANINIADITIISSSRSSSLPNALVNGGIADWMNVQVENDTVSATISYPSGNDVIKEQNVSVNLKATDASSGTYTQLSSLISQESTPVGLAQMIYEGACFLPYEGRITMTQSEVDGPTIGRKLNITGGRSDWSTMDAQIQEIQESIDEGITTIRFGSATHLGIKDLIQLTRMNRGREAPRTAYIRSTGAGSDSILEQASKLASKEAQTGKTSYSKWSIQHQNDASRSFILDTAEIPQSGMTIQLQEEDVCDDGVLKKRLSFASEPYTTTP